MGFSQGTCTDSSDISIAPNVPLPPPSSSSSSLLAHHYCDHNNLKFRTFLGKMIWDFGFACLSSPSSPPPSSSSSSRRRNSCKDDECSNKKGNLEHNKAWLLAESGGCGAELLNNAEPQSVHSSFRFSFCSQVELESLNMSSSSAATVLMVNLDNGVSESRAREIKWRRIESLEKSISPVAHSLIRFTYAEILSATRNFSKGRVLGRGALSCVFRGRVGILRTVVAIKRLDKEDKESAKAFCRELMIASSLHSPNVVPLVGFCIDPEEGLFLVYKYVSGGSLERHLHGRKKGGKGSSPLPWSVRYKVAIGIAEAVAYLHNGTERCVVHRDIKPSNILLSSKKTPKLCDFGLATWTTAPSVPFLCKTVKGTFGYLAPEYFQHGKVSDKTDVYAFGVVLLELITGRKPIEAKRSQGEENLVLWAKPFLQKGKGAIDELLDPQLKCSLRFSNQIARMIEAAAASVTNEESRRPGIHEIIAILKGEEEPLFSKRKKSGFLGNGCVIDCYSQLEQTNNEMKSHLALAMLGVSEFEDEDYLYGR
ncbi:hypothetical protein HN51_013395 [Arachis hypogaea]|uniref:Protein kinase domain-containing protein n=2 Tax=Arachis TaxID=3817 RepID=A0A445DQG0_ARAHY|nr:probable serine/threonine-protein kinase PBL7 [Arachis duranensis]XP_025690321.1 probable serine/threonine-protein kinase PBL7 [Arachis hypogaea]XP_057748597.1 probable serine/threonine-protein kinase PBL7 [Arachis stenosperma]QHO59101.1 Proline-rich receptor-like protein kinase [Arachis hypogaea]RYR65406.1 hypothetical protein Ahy_A03g011339 isoform B [Arachis hypogaea]